MSGTDILFSLLPLIILNSMLLVPMIPFAFIYRRRGKSEEVLKRMHTTYLGVFVREYYYWLNEPFIALFRALGVTPNMITLFSLFLSFISAYFFFVGYFATAGWILIVSATLDILDGKLARLTGKESREGSFLDSCADRFSEGAIFFGIAMYFAAKTDILVAGVHANIYFVALTILSLVGSQIVSYSKARGEAVGFTTNAGFMQRAERVVLLAAASVLQPFFSLMLVRFSLDGHCVFGLMLLLMAASTNYSAVERTVAIFRDLKRSSSGNE